MKDGFIIAAIISIFIFTFLSCCEKPVQGSNFFSFDYEGQSYRIRSVSFEENGYSYNELIGKKFVANDYDQDGIIDKITYGDKSITEAQIVYEYVLSILAERDKLRPVKPIYHSYQLITTVYDYEIKTFRPKYLEPFNQFKVIEKEVKTPAGFIIGIDQKADGTIDTVVTGTMPLKNIQTLYTNVIQKGLQMNKLSKTGDMIIVK